MNLRKMPEIITERIPGGIPEGVYEKNLSRNSEKKLPLILGEILECLEKSLKESLEKSVMEFLEKYLVDFLEEFLKKPLKERQKKFLKKKIQDETLKKILEKFLGELLKKTKQKQDELPDRIHYGIPEEI